MRRMCLSIVTLLAFFVAAAVAQTTPSAPPDQQSTGATAGSQSSSPSTAAPSDTQTGTSNMGQQGNTGYGNTSGAKGETKLKGCVQSQGGQYVLETKKGKTVPLTGQDLSAHVGHEVTVHGTWQTASAGSTTDMSAAGSSPTSNAGMGASEGNAFSVSSVDMISKSCGGKNKHDKMSEPQ